MNKYFHGLLFGVSVLPALAIMPAMAGFSWDHPDVDSYSTINGIITRNIGPLLPTILLWKQMARIGR